MRPWLSRFTTTIVVALLVVGCASAASPAPITTPPPSAPPTSSPSASTSRPTPSLGPVSPVITGIIAGDFHTCATVLAVLHGVLVTSGAGIKCWGSNDSGQLGNGTMTHSSSAVGVSGLAGPDSGVSLIEAGGHHSCALMGGGEVKCWGANLWGQLGNGTTADSSVPVDVADLPIGIQAIATSGDGTCALTGGGGVKCWGTNAYWPDCGESPCDIGSSNIPVDVPGLTSGVSAIAAGGRHTCVLTSGGGVKCWGGEFGNGSTSETLVPADVAGLASGVSAIAAGGRHTCVLTSGSGVKCWGINDSGELGDGTTTASNIPVDVTGLTSGVSAIAAGYTHTCVLTSDGAVKCWGANWRGQLGNDSPGVSGVPLEVDFANP